MVNNSLHTRRKTGVFKIVKIGKKVSIRLPRFISPLIIILFVTIFAIILVFPYTKTVELFDLPKVGESAKETVIAPFTFDIIRSPDEVERERKRVMDQVLIVTDYDETVLKQVRRSFHQLRASVYQLAARTTSDSQRSQIRTQLSRQLSENTINTIVKRQRLIDDALYQASLMLEKGVVSSLLAIDKNQLDELKLQYNTPFENNIIYNKEFVAIRKKSGEYAARVSDLVVKEIGLEQIIKKMKSQQAYDDETLSALYEVMYVLISPNVKLNGAETMTRKLDASKSVLSITGKVIRDTEIARKHQEVTPEIIEKLQSLQAALDKRENIAEQRKVKAGNAGRLMMVIIPLLFMAFYLKYFRKDLIKAPKHVAAFATILVLQLMLIRGSLLIIPKLFEGVGEFTSLAPEYLIPTTMCSILTAILFGLELSFVLTLFVSIYFGVILGFNQFFFILSLFSGITACFCAKSIRYRWHFFNLIPWVVLVYVVIISLWHLIGFKLSFGALFQSYGLAVINVLGSIFLAMMLTAVFERLFDLTTDMTLVELSDMNHPILKRLSIEAAGTYNHSVLVGNLAESAAARIGANPLLARVASYYHDIGKIEKADYFVENYLNGDRDRHSKLTPSMSSLIISAHVKDGFELAKRHRLPKVIQDAILQHHGTSTVSFFFEKALEQDPHKQVQEADFCYPGPPPQTPENAIIMLADSVEAASRSLATSSTKLLRDLVKKIIRDKFLASQLDKCDLSLRDLDEIVEGFMPVLQGIFHTRIKYPK